MCYEYSIKLLQWRHNDHDCVSNHQPRGCLLNRLLRRRSKKTPKLRVTGLWVGNSPGPVNSPHKRPVTWKMFPFDDVIMSVAGMHGRLVQVENIMWCDLQRFYPKKVVLSSVKNKIWLIRLPHDDLSYEKRCELTHQNGENVCFKIAWMPRCPF